MRTIMITAIMSGGLINDLLSPQTKLVLKQYTTTYVKSQYRSEKQESHKSIITDVVTYNIQIVKFPC